MRKLWRGEVIRKQSSPREQGDCAFDKYLNEIGNTHNSDTHVASILESESLQLLHGSRIQGQALLQPLRAEDPGESRDTILLPILEHQTIQGMTSIVGNYQHERNDNLDDYFKAVGMFKSATKNDCGIPYDGSKNKYALTACVTGVPYIPRKMMSMSHPQLQISNDGDKWTIRTISMIRTVELTFTLGEEYEEYMAAGVTLKNVTTMEGDSLVTVSVGPDNNKVVRKYETTEDGVLLTMTHEKSGQVAKRYFTRVS